MGAGQGAPAFNASIGHARPQCLSLRSLACRRARRYRTRPPMTSRPQQHGKHSQKNHCSKDHVLDADRRPDRLLEPRACSLADGVTDSDHGRHVEARAERVCSEEDARTHAGDTRDGSSSEAKPWQEPRAEHSKGAVLLHEALSGVELGGGEPQPVNVRMASSGTGRPTFPSTTTAKIAAYPQCSTKGPSMFVDDSRLQEPGLGYAAVQSLWPGENDRLRAAAVCVAGAREHRCVLVCRAPATLRRSAAICGHRCMTDLARDLP